ncbi:MAG: SPOR domain-containing protein [Stagnimonas sp.]|nr:SPOR domain-containing protein [Stagnimonas sp.]
MLSRALLLATALFTSSTAWAASELLAVKVDGTARLVRADGNRALLARMPLLNGDSLSLSGDSRVALQLAGRGLITLARGAELQVFDSRGGATAQGRFKLLSGTVRVDSRGRPAQDVRLNVGSLKARIYGAEALGANDAAGDTLCVLAGAIEVQTAGAPDTRLDLPGSCVRRSPDGLLRNLRLDSDTPMTTALAASEFRGAAEALAGTGRPAPGAAPIIAPVAAAGTAPTAPLAAAAGSKAKGWTVVVLSLSQREPVDQRTQSLLDQGLPASARSAEVKGKLMHRVTVGEFASQDEARDFARGTLAKAGIQGWISPLF